MKSVYNDLYEIITNLEGCEEKIPQKFINFIDSQRDPDYISTIDHSVDLDSQELSEDLISLLAILGITYLCPNEQTRYELAKAFYANEGYDSFTNEDYQKILSTFDYYNEVFGPIPFWKVSRRR